MFIIEAPMKVLAGFFSEVYYIYFYISFSLQWSNFKFISKIYQAEWRALCQISVLMRCLSIDEVISMIIKSSKVSESCYKMCFRTYFMATCLSPLLSCLIFYTNGHSGVVAGRDDNLLRFSLSISQVTHLKTALSFWERI